MPSLNYQYIARLVDKAKSGNSDAFAELYAATYQKEYSYAYHFLQDEYLAQDALQETYILVLKNLSNLKDPLLFVSWVNQICFRVCFNMQHKQNKHSEVILPTDEVLASSNANTGPTPEDRYIVVEDQSYIINQVMSLPYQEAQAIILRYYKNMKADDIAKMLNVSTRSVTRYIKSGLTRLKKLLENYD